MRTALAGNLKLKGNLFGSEKGNFINDHLQGE